MDESIDFVRRIVPQTETTFVVGTSTPANALVQRDGTLIVQRDGTQIVNQRP